MHFFSVSFVDFEQANVSWESMLVIFILLTFDNREKYI